MKKKKFLTVIAALLLSLSVVGAASAGQYDELQDGSKSGKCLLKITSPLHGTLINLKSLGKS